MKWILDRSSGSPRHPLVEAGKRLEGKRATGTDLETFFRRLLSTPLHVATHRPVELFDAADVMVLDLASDHDTALPAYLDAPEALVTLGQIGGWAAVLGADACRLARERHCHELAVFVDPQRDPELIVRWDAIDWLGAGLVPFWVRNAGDHAILASPELEDACRTAVASHEEIEMAQLIEGVAADGSGRAVILATVWGSILPRRWFDLRDRIEAELLVAGHMVTVVTEPEATVAETKMTAEWQESPSPLTGDGFIK